MRGNSPSATAKSAVRVRGFPTQFAVLSAISLLALVAPVFAQMATLPMRDGARPETTSSVPHVQIGVQAVPELSEELLRQLDQLPDVDLKSSRLSLPGAVGFVLADGAELARPDAIVGGREFAHLHPDGSLHAALDPDLAKVAVSAGWATPHPWAAERAGWEGFVMIYTPSTQEELEIVIDLVQSSYSFVTGRETKQ